MAKISGWIKWGRKSRGKVLFIKTFHLLLLRGTASQLRCLRAGPERRKVSGTPTRPCPQYFHLMLRTTTWSTRIVPILQRRKWRCRKGRKRTWGHTGVYYISSLASGPTAVRDKTCRVHQAILPSPQCLQGPGARQRKGLWAESRGSFTSMVWSGFEYWTRWPHC